MPWLASCSRPTTRRGCSPRPTGPRCRSACSRPSGCPRTGRPSSPTWWRSWREHHGVRAAVQLLYKIAAGAELGRARAPTQIDLDYHLRHSALPAPGSQRELGVLVSRLHSREDGPPLPAVGVPRDRGPRGGPLVALPQGAPLARSTASAASGCCAASSPPTPTPATCCRRGRSAPAAPTSPGIPRTRQGRRRRAIERSGADRRRVRGGVRSARRRRRLAGSHLRRERHRHRRRRRPGRAVPGAEVDLQRPDPHAATVRDPALPDRAAARASPRRPTAASTTSSSRSAVARCAAT